MGDNILLSKDTVSAKLAKCFLKVPNESGGFNRYDLFLAKKLEAKFEKKKVDVPRLGTTVTGHKSTGLNLTGTMTLYYATSLFRKMILDFKKTGKDIYFEIQITNEDPTTSLGRQTVILKNCNIDSGTLAFFDATSDDPIEEEVSFTFDDFDMPEEFEELIGLKVA